MNSIHRYSVARNDTDVHVHSAGKAIHVRIKLSVGRRVVAFGWTSRRLRYFWAPRCTFSWEWVCSLRPMVVTVRQREITAIIFQRSCIVVLTTGNYTVRFDVGPWCVKCTTVAAVCLSTETRVLCRQRYFDGTVGGNAQTIRSCGSGTECPEGGVKCEGGGKRKDIRQEVSLKLEHKVQARRLPTTTTKYNKRTSNSRSRIGLLYPQ